MPKVRDAETACMLNMGTKLGHHIGAGISIALAPMSFTGLWSYGLVGVVAGGLVGCASAALLMRMNSMTLSELKETEAVLENPLLRSWVLSVSEVLTGLMTGDTDVVVDCLVRAPFNTLFIGGLGHVLPLPDYFYSETPAP